MRTGRSARNGNAHPVRLSSLPDRYIGLMADNCNDIVFCDNVVENVFYGAMIEDVGVRAWVNDNRFVGLIYSLARTQPLYRPGSRGNTSDIRADHRAERNVIRDFMTGVTCLPARRAPG